jgi:uncharacterized protein YjbI with pentapeptide repeats
LAEDEIEKERPGRWVRDILYWHEGKDIHPLFAAFLTVCAGLILAAVAAATLWMIGRFVYTVFTYTVPPEDDLAGLRNLALILAAVIGAPFVVWRSLVAHWQARTAEQGLITSRITQAVEQLGTEKTVRSRVRPVTYTLEGTIDTRTIFQTADVEFQLPSDAESTGDVEIAAWTTYEQTVPNLEVRLGAIYALERIAQDSARDHIPIMETLCAYIRENAPASSAVANPLPDWEPLADDADDEARKAHEEAWQERFDDSYFDSRAYQWARTLPQPRADIQAALTVLGRRGEDAIRREAAADRPYRLDLRAVNLQRADLSALNLGPALLVEARMDGANLFEARMDGANLRGARMEGANLTLAGMEGADLRGARMEGANLGEARMEGANLGEARMERAELSRARMDGANLREARMEGANLTFAGMEGADLRAARMEGVELASARMEGADFSHAYLEGARFSCASIGGAKFWSAQMRGASLRSCLRRGIPRTDLA